MIEGYLVAKQIGIPLACKCLIRRAAPMIDENAGHQCINMVVVHL